MRWSVKLFKRELDRDGQVYYVYNRVSDIAEIADHVQKLVPDATVAFAHGQMAEHELENIMYDFINGEIDVLVSTTIIETGLDISNVNTMIIHDADRLGLSQMYQLRGRVGRSNRMAYAFLLYRRDKLLKEVAEKDWRQSGSLRILVPDLRLRCEIWRSAEPEIFWEQNSMGIWRLSDMICTARCSMKR